MNSLPAGGLDRETNYTLRVHPRARRVRLRVDERGQLTVTVPRHFDRRRLPALLAERRGWIEAVRADIDRQRAFLAPELKGPRPGRIELPALDEVWQVEYEPIGSSKRGKHWSAGSRASIGLEEIDHGRLALRLPESDERADLDASIAAGLRAWLQRRAGLLLPGQVSELADRHGFRFSRIAIRNQRSRWGSCSASGSLSLNMRLLFASPGACRYVLVHELVHTEHLNHSPAFWARVAEIEPEFRAHQRELRQVWQRLPDWL